MASTFISLPLSNILGPIDVVGSVLVTGTNEYEYNEILNVAIGATAIVVSRAFPVEYKLRRVSATGNNLATYTIYFDSTPVDKKRSAFNDFNCEFDYESGITIPAGTTVSVEVQNSSQASLGDFSARLLFSAQ